MRLLRLLAVVGVMGVAHYFWSTHQQHGTPAEQMTDSGFVRTVMVDGATPGTVLILAPPNCPSEGARHAVELSRRLAQMGIPFVMGSSFSVSIPFPNSDEQAGIDRAVAVFNQGAPAVFVNDMAKSNPTADEVAYEYRKATRRN